MPDGARVADPRDCTDQDIALLIGEFRRLALTHRSGDLMVVSIINLLELLFQSARTRICIFKVNDRLYSKINRPHDLFSHISFHTFRQDRFFKKFCEYLIGLEKPISIWLSSNAIMVDDSLKKPTIAIALARSIPPDKFVYDPHENEALKESYQRLARFLDQLAAAPYLMEEFCSILKKNKSKRIYGSIWNEKCTLPTNISSTFWGKNHLVDPIYKCVNDIYQEFKDIPLLQVENKNKIANKTICIDYKNLFFFVRLHASIDSSVDLQDTQDGFVVKLICADTQQKELSLFFHKQRYQKCPWYEHNGICHVRNIKHCLFHNKWEEISEQTHDKEVIYQHYYPIWKELGGVSGNKPKLAGAAFRSNTIVFERRAFWSNELDEKTVLTRPSADRLLSCIKSRLIDPPLSYRKENPNGEDEDYVPQLMFVPIYHHETAIVSVATVINAKLFGAIKEQVSEWQQAFQFANYVYRSLAYRFKSKMQEVYLSLIEDTFKTELRQIRNNITINDLHSRRVFFLEEINKKFSALAEIYAYPKFSLLYVHESVINRDIHFNTADELSEYFFVSVEPSTYWELTPHKQWFPKSKILQVLKNSYFSVLGGEANENMAAIDDHLHRQQLKT